MSWLGFDIGGTRIKAGLLSDEGAELAAFAEHYDSRAGIQALEETLRMLGSRTLAASHEKLRGIGASITGPVDPASGCVYLPGKVEGLGGHPTVPFLSGAFAAPCIADNDGALACFAEWKAGAGRGVDNLVVLTLGTGIGSGVIIDGKPLKGGGFLRGLQAGHFVIDVDGPLCLTGAHGTGESIATITALINSARDHLLRGIPSSLDPATLDFPAFVEALKAGDRLANEVFDCWFRGFSAVALNAYLAYVPDRILLAGGPVAAADLFLSRLKETLERNAFRYPPDKPIDIRCAELGERAGWIGAAIFARETFTQTKT